MKNKKQKTRNHDTIPLNPDKTGLFEGSFFWWGR